MPLVVSAMASWSPKNRPRRPASTLLNVYECITLDDVKELVAFRLEPEQIERLDALADGLSKHSSGVNVSRSAAARVALERGISELEKEIGMAPKKGAKPASKPKE